MESIAAGGMAAASGTFRAPPDPAPLDLSTLSPSLLVDAPDDLLALATDLLLSGDIAHGAQCLDLFERAVDVHLL